MTFGGSERTDGSTVDAYRSSDAGLHRVSSAAATASPLSPHHAPCAPLRKNSARRTSSTALLACCMMWNFVVDDGAVRRPFLDAGLIGFPHGPRRRPRSVAAGVRLTGVRKNSSSVSFFRSPPEPQGLSALQIAGYCYEFRGLSSQKDLIHAQVAATLASCAVRSQRSR